MDVLALIDKQYMGRFWPQYECFMGLQEVTQEGLVPQHDHSLWRLHMSATGLAKLNEEAHKKELLHLWSRRSLEDAIDFLSKNDIQVTNKADKINCIQKL